MNFSVGDQSTEEQVMAVPVVVTISGFHQQVYAARERRTDDSAVMELVRRWDNAKTKEEREHWLEVIYKVLGSGIEDAVRSRSRGRLTRDQIEALAWRALQQSLGEFGRSRYKLTDVVGNDWTEPLKELSQQARSHPFAATIWHAIPQAIRSQIEAGAAHLHRNTQQQAITAINQALSKPELASLAAEVVQSEPEGQQLLAKPIAEMNRAERSFLCATALHQILPELRKPEPPPISLYGHVLGFSLKQLVPEAVAEERGELYDAGTTTALSRLMPDIQEELQMSQTGTLPEGWEALSRPERIRRLQLQRIRREYGDRLAWWADTARKLGRNLSITGADSWSEAKKLFIEHGIDPQLWAYKHSPYYLPRSVAHPYGVTAIQRALDLLERRPRMPSQPTAPVAAPAAGAATQDSRDPDLYRAIVYHIYASPRHEAERAVGELLSRDPRPSQSTVEAWISQLPTDIASDVRDFGFLNLAREIDAKVREFITEPGALRHLERMIGQPVGREDVVAVRRSIFLRRALGYVKPTRQVRTA